MDPSTNASGNSPRTCTTPCTSNTASPHEPHDPPLRTSGPRGGRPPAFDSLDYRGRNVIERRFKLLNQWRGLATRYGKLAIVYRSAIVLHAVIRWTKASSDTP
ncbi:transposase [Amycolatopsis sp. DSM 110486]|uniref:transposase n=1 Tax=Amycolatopsis sp. DSM 110486 TaxID=2865832 RepID=UPI00351D76B3